MGAALLPGDFFGPPACEVVLDGIALSHRIADKEADEIEAHTHADAHFILVTGGHYVTAAQRRPGAAGLLVFNPVATCHRDRFEPGLGSYFAVSVAPAEARRLCAGLPDEPRSLTARAPRVLAQALLRESLRGAPALHLESLCLELLGSFAPPRDGEALPPWLLRAQQWIEDCYAEPLELRRIARGVGVHPIHLARGFRRHFRCTAGEFLLRRRLEAAAQLLIASRLPLSEVALVAGFADQSHFTKRFRAAFGVPPGTYRRRTRR